MEQTELVKSKCDLEEDLAKNELMKNDVKKIVGYITPLVPYIGLISGGITVGKHVIIKRTEERKATAGSAGSAGSKRSEESAGYERSE